MLPIFAAAGHINYAKSVSLHGQDLYKYEKEVIGREDFKKY